MGEWQNDMLTRDKCTYRKMEVAMMACVVGRGKDHLRDP